MDIATCERFVSTNSDRWEPVPWQGANSRTFRNSEKTTILQFRDPNEPLDDETCNLAARIHADLAPHTKYLGQLPEQHSVLIWQMQCLPGDPYLFHASSLTPEQVSTAVIDFSRFFAAAWKQPQFHSEIRADRYVATLKPLFAALPAEFHGVIDLVLAHLDDVLALRPVLTHSDLASGNILIDPRTGHLTGIVDWAEATIEPFGLGLWGLQDILGFHGPQGYTYLHDAEANRNLFRKTFLDASSFDGDVQHLEWARLLGVFIRFGYTWDSHLRKRVPIKGESDLDFLKICIQGSLFSNSHNVYGEGLSWIQTSNEEVHSTLT